MGVMKGDARSSDYSSVGGEGFCGLRETPRAHFSKLAPAIPRTL